MRYGPRKKYFPQPPGNPTPPSLPRVLGCKVMVASTLARVVLSRLVVHVAWYKPWRKMWSSAASCEVPNGLVKVVLVVAKLVWTSGRGGAQTALRGEAWAGSFQARPTAPHRPRSVPITQVLAGYGQIVGRC